MHLPIMLESECKAVYRERKNSEDRENCWKIIRMGSGVKAGMQTLGFL